MNRNHLWRFILIVLIVLWSLYEVYPPTNRDLVQYFREKAVRQDDTFRKIVAEAQVLTQ